MASLLQALSRATSVSIFRTLLINYVRYLWRPVVRNPERLPRKGPCFFYGNHSNRWDPFILNCFTPWLDPTAGVLTQEFFRSRFLRWIFLNADVHPTKKRMAEPHLIRSIYRMLDEGRKIIIYPEGGSRWDGRPMPWIESTAKVFIRTGVPIYPIITHGSYVTWPRWATYPRPGRVELEIGEPMTFARRTPVAEALEQLKAPISFNENEPPEHLRPTKARRPADGIHKLLYRDPQTGDLGGLYTPDGTTVRNRAGTHTWTMLPDSRLRDEKDGTLYTTAELYDQIRAFPLETQPDGTLASQQVTFATEDEFPNLREHGPATIELYDDALRIKQVGTSETIPFERIVGVDVERNYKLQCFLSDRMLQFTFANNVGSALFWRNALSSRMEDSYT